MGLFTNRPFQPAALLCSLMMVGGCGTMGHLFEDPSEQNGYRLVGLYDASSVRQTEQMLTIPEEERPPGYEYMWTPPAAMTASCGDAKAPDGLGVFEAVAMANRMLPTLAVVVERVGDVPPLDSSRLQVALANPVEAEAPPVFLEPAVMPRHLKLNIEGNGAERYLRQVENQLQRFLCLEHKTGRAWQGGDAREVRQALLIQDADFKLADRRYFGGQSSPVAALLGPPEACFQSKIGKEGKMSDAAKGGSSVSLTPADVFGATLGECDSRIQVGSTYVGTRAMRLAMSTTPFGKPDPRSPDWSQLNVTINAKSDLQSEHLVEVTYQGEEYIGAQGARAMDEPRVLLSERPLFEALTNDEGELSGEYGLKDLVSEIPYRYPTVGDAEDEERYTVLLIPNWQLVEAVKRIKSDEPDRVQPNAGKGVQDGVGWLLEHPDALVVMVPEIAETFDPFSDEDQGDWLNIARPLSSRIFGIDWRAWGYTTGMLGGRSPIALPGDVTPSWQQVSSAQRSAQHAIFIGSAAFLMAFFIMGAVRLRELWLESPEERVEFWPGPTSDEEGGDEDDAADLGGVGGGDE